MAVGIQSREISNLLLDDITLGNYDYYKAFKRWQLIHDVYSDEIITNEFVFKRHVVIPYAGKSYTGSLAKAVAQLQDDFFKGADFTNVLSRTAAVMVGTVKIKKSDIRLSGLEEMVDQDNLIKSVKASLLDTTLYSRCGLFVNASDIESELSVADVRNGMGANIHTYHPWQILDWDEDSSGVLNYVLLAEPTVEKSIDNLGTGKAVIEYRLIYRDDDGDVIIRILNNKKQVLQETPVINSAGQPSKTFPFFFIGAFTNTPEINKPIMYPMAKKNAVLLTYSAHANQSMRQFGNPILWLAPSESMQDSFNSEITAGGLTGYNLGQGGNAGFAQPSPNTLATDGKDLLIAELVKMGARLVLESAANQTAEAARIQHSGDISTLVSIINNLSSAYTQALRLLADYNGVNFTEDLESDTFIGMSIDDKVIDTKAESAMLQALSSSVSLSTLPLQTLYKYVKDSGLIDKEMTFEEYERLLNAQAFSNNPNEGENIG